MIRFLLDDGFPEGTLGALRDLGMTITTLGEASLDDRTPAGLLAHARAGGFVLVTRDPEVARALEASKARSPSVIEIRRDDEDPNECASQIRNVVATNDDDLITGLLVRSRAVRPR